MAPQVLLLKRLQSPSWRIPQQAGQSDGLGGRIVEKFSYEVRFAVYFMLWYKMSNGRCRRMHKKGIDLDENEDF